MMIKKLRLANLKTDISLFNQIIALRKAKSEKPVIIASLTPNLGLVSISRLIKLAELNKNNFEIIIFFNSSIDEVKNNMYLDLINKFIPSDKEIILYSSLLNKLSADKEYYNFLDKIKLCNIYQLLKNKKDFRKLSLLNLYHFATQYYIIKNKFCLQKEPDFFMTTPFKNYFLKMIIEEDKGDFPLIVSLEDFEIDWNFDQNINTFEKLISTNKISHKQTKLVIEEIIKPFRAIFLKEKEFGNINLPLELNKIKKFIFGNLKLEENLIIGDKCESVILALDNKLRRKLLTVIINNSGIRAEEIRFKINKEVIQYTLQNITKHLNILTMSGIIYKEKRRYYPKSKKIVLEYFLDQPRIE